MAEGMQPSLRIHRRPVGRGKHYAAGADRRRNGPRRQDPHAHRARALIARTRRHRRALPSARSPALPRRRSARRPPALRTAAAASSIGMPAASATSRAPAPVGHVQQQRPAGLLHVDRELAGQPVTDIVLRAQHVRDLREDLRLVLAHPEQLGQRKVRQRRIRDQLYQPRAADLLRRASRTAAASAGRTRSAPAEAPAPSASSITQPCIWPVSPMLRSPVPWPRSCELEFGADSFLRRPPPVVRILFGPADVLGPDLCVVG